MTDLRQALLIAAEAKLKERNRWATTHCQCEACKNGNIHDSDCSVHNGDALPVGPCDCSLATPPQQQAEPVAWPMEEQPDGAVIPVDPADMAPPQQQAEPVIPAHLDVRKILLAVTPGAGSGLEVYAKSVNDVVNTLTKMDERLERLEQQQAEPVTWAGYDLDGMVEAFSRVIEAHHSSKHPFHNPIDMSAKMALRILRGFIPAMKAYATSPKQQAEPVQERITHITWDERGVRTVNGIPDDAPRCKELSASEILNMMPSAIPAEYDGPLMEFARAVEAKLKERNT